MSADRLLFIIDDKRLYSVPQFAAFLAGVDGRESESILEQSEPDSDDEEGAIILRHPNYPHLREWCIVLGHEIKHGSLRTFYIDGRRQPREAELHTPWAYKYLTPDSVYYHFLERKDSHPIATVALQRIQAVFLRPIEPGENPDARSEASYRKIIYALLQ